MLVILTGTTAAAQAIPPAAGPAPEGVPPVSQNVRVDVTVLEDGGQSPSSRENHFIDHSDRS
jgi:hypothetical protein